MVSYWIYDSVLPKLNISRSVNFLKLWGREIGGEKENYLNLPKVSKTENLHTHKNYPVFKKIKIYTYNKDS